MRPRQLILSAVFLCAFGCQAPIADAATIHSYRDRISDSAPATSSNHTIEFRTTVALDPSDLIRFTLDPDDFEIPLISEDFNHENVELLVSTGGPYAIRPATTTPSATEDGVTIVSGTSGSVTVTLNSTVGIPANADIRLLIGNHTQYSTSTDTGILNPSATGTFAYTIGTGNLEPPSLARGLIAIVDPVSVPNVNTTETVPPFRFNGAPTGDLSGTTLMVELSLETDEFALCRYSLTPNVPYASMGNQFTTNFSTIHTRILAVATNTVYAVHVRCVDDENNANPDDYIINFTILPPPTGTPGDGDNQSGSGSGNGTGGGSSGSGGGSSSGGGGGSSSGGGGGGSSGNEGDDGGAGLTSPERPYQSGDGEVTIRGYAFPQSSVVVLVDGVIARNTRAGGDGAFSVTLTEIARGAYAFGVYAIDRDNVRSSTFSTTFTVTGSRASTLSNVNVMPSISVSPNPVTPGQTLTIKGYSIPDAVVTIENQNDRTSAGLKTFTTNASGNGAWSIEMPTDGMSNGTYKVRARARQEETGISTNFSSYTFYGVGQQAQLPRGSDLNRDGKVNLIDFSILLFWWNTNGGTSNPSADINGDGKVSLTDFSIMIFNWTG
jgi:hypothetical protein